MDDQECEMMRSRYIIEDPELMKVEFTLKDRALRLNTSSDAEKYARLILETDGITDVCLSGNTFGVGAGRAIAAALRCQNQLRRVDLSDMFTSRLESEIPLVLEAFSDTLTDKEYLEELDLSDNAFGPTGAQPLSRLLSGNYYIKMLKMNNNGLGPEGVKHVSRALMSAHNKALRRGHKPRLETVYLGRNRIGNEGVGHLSEAIRLYSNQLSGFYLPQNGISGRGIEDLFKSLSHCKDLTHLDLQDNTFSVCGCNAFAEVAPLWEKLAFLDISGCLLTPEGGVRVIEALTDGNRLLKHIDLRYGDIDRKGAMLIPKMLENKLLLLYLGLNGNVFPSKGHHINNIRSVLAARDCADCLGTLDEMEEEDSDQAFSEDYGEEIDDQDVDVHVGPASQSSSILANAKPLIAQWPDRVLFTSVPDRENAITLNTSDKSEPPPPASTHRNPEHSKVSRTPPNIPANNTSQSSPSSIERQEVSPKEEDATVKDTSEPKVVKQKIDPETNVNSQENDKTCENDNSHFVYKIEDL